MPGEEINRNKLRTAEVAVVFGGIWWFEFRSFFIFGLYCFVHGGDVSFRRKPPGTP